MLYLGYGIFYGSRFDEAFVQTSARDDRVFETFPLVFLDVLRRFALHTETRSKQSTRKPICFLLLFLVGPLTSNVIARLIYRMVK